MSKLSILAERVMEAAWLCALIIEPLFFNVYSDRVFEPDKLALLRSIALVVVAAWLVRWVETSSAAGEEGQKPSLWKRIRGTPLALHTLLLVGVYLLSTVTSVVPRLSLWGSYQRMQGTYSTFSYIVIFAVILGTLRRREQLERLLLIAILTSLPISLYGLVQHYRLDPLPWGGDVTARVASNMGNSIFVAAYLIMIVPLTLRNLLESLSAVLREEAVEVKAAFLVGYLVAVGVQLAAWLVVGFTAGLVVGTAFIFLTGLFSLSMRKPLLRFLWIGVYSVALVAQLVCILFTQSRGPVLGLLGGIFAFILVLAFVRRIRWLQWTSIGSAAGIGLFLLVFNLPNSALQPLKRLPYVGRLGRVFETERGTGKVRLLIWEGVVQLIGFHEPLGLPEQKDKLNALRPLIGYGPESMIVAYNPFYQPDLAHYERRNASPDRSHNETFDALATTGLIGFLVYFSLFTSFFYYSLRWLGLIENQAHRNTFLGLGIGGATLGVVGPLIVDGSLRLAGVFLPFLFMVGVGLYLIISSFTVSRRASRADSRELLLIALFAAIVAHFVEIHFGIAIAATRTYFWVLAGLAVVVGMEWVPLEEATPEPQAVAMETLQPSSRRRRRKSRRKAETKAPSSPPKSPAWGWAGVWAYAFLVALIFVTLGYDFVTNQLGAERAWDVVANSLTKLKEEGQIQTSLAMLWLFLFVWLLGGIMALTRTPEPDGDAAQGGKTISRYLATLGIYAGITLPSFLIFALQHGARLKPGNDIAQALTPYYMAAFAALLATAFLLWKETFPPDVFVRRTSRWVQLGLVPASAALCVVLINALNLSMIKADIYYKQGKYADREQIWDAAIAYYRKSIDLTKNQDFYYLFLGRAYLEKSGGVTDPAERISLFEQARDSLLEARRLNPLNTDHSANLARLYRTWAEMVNDPQEREQALRRALSYYEDATTLSPSTAKLYNEYGLIHALLGEPEKALEKYQLSLSLDQAFEETYLYMGNLYLQEQRYEEAAEAYRKAIEIKPQMVQAHSALGYVYSKQGKLEEAVAENLAVLEVAPNDYSSRKNLAILYQQMGRLQEALREANAALAVAPTQDASALQAFIAQLEQNIKQVSGGS